jgi:hypothetical protein
MIRGACVGVLWCALTAGTAAADTGYEERFEAALTLERQGEYEAALDTLDDLEGEFPQDYNLMLQLGWLAYNAGEHARAHRYYSRAEALSGGSAESRDGLEAVASRQKVRGHGRASLLGYGYPAIGESTWGLGLVAGGGVQWRRLVAGITYRYGRFTSTSMGPPEPMGPGGPVGASGSFGQHEIYVAAGASWERLGLTGHYAAVHETSSTLGTGHVLGAAARFSPLGDVTVEASLSHYDDADVFRTAASWQLPLGRGFWIQPGGSMQVVDETVLGAGHLDLGYGDDRGEIWLGGKGGSEFRPAYLTDDAAYNILETIPWGAHLGGRIYLTERWSLTGTVEAYGATATELGDAGDGSDHVGVVGSIGAAFDF